MDDGLLVSIHDALMAYTVELRHDLEGISPADWRIEVTFKYASRGSIFYPLSSTRLADGSPRRIFYGAREGT